MTDQQPLRKCLLAMPGYSGLRAGAAAAWFLASAGGAAPVPIEIKRQWNQGSLLGQNFNALWCMALNYKVDYFAMLHADISAQKGWLDLLISELEFRGFDVLSAVVPIKSHQGVTSTALDWPGGGEWLPQCRLTLKEVYQLPETFTAEDVGYPLLLNTGCWVAKMGPWSKQCHFTIRDRLVQDEKGWWKAEVEPEDWGFSRQCNRLGLKIAATRKVMLFHDGEQTFGNNESWGDMFDREYLDKSIIPHCGPDGFKFPFDVGGWLLPEEGIALAHLSEGKRVLEIGSYLGRSTICIAQTAEHVTSIDPHNGVATGRPCNTFPDFKRNLERYGLSNVDTLIGTTEDIAQVRGEFDVVFIDGAHDAASVQYDLSFALRHLADDGLIAFHDYRNQAGAHDGRWDPGVTETVDRFLSEGAELVATHATLAVIKPPVAMLTENAR